MEYRYKVLLMNILQNFTFFKSKPMYVSIDYPKLC